MLTKRDRPSFTVNHENLKQGVSMEKGKQCVRFAVVDRFVFTTSKGTGVKIAEEKPDAITENKEAGAQHVRDGQPS